MLSARRTHARVSFISGRKHERSQTPARRLHPSIRTEADENILILSSASERRRRQTARVNITCGRDNGASGSGSGTTARCLLLLSDDWLVYGTSHFITSRSIFPPRRSGSSAARQPLYMIMFSCAAGFSITFPFLQNRRTQSFLFTSEYFLLTTKCSKVSGHLSSLLNTNRFSHGPTGTVGICVHGWNDKFLFLFRIVPELETLKNA